ncbi:MAG: lipoprotein-releasing system transmembrane subunit LolC [Acidobacteria bacterium]|jgi:lipoprotein-releasing system permease protein|nr:lipoprotein-releasing system transmembrane subunit LolC [Acidobacteriota bacterium]MDP7338948.1 ABC transporter permease [Vicinamibacterales bacterium]HJN43656.1 ABC transporter permease [Vicinamibacterales bacterium]|tara:strand:+ start:10903 stop:12141 length:1239 start_codon:yes stop_codon:yes gene_type:complete
MTPPFELYIATRYLLARRRQAFISLISLVSTGGVAVGVMALVIAMALMTGMQQDIRDKLIGAQAHVYVYKITGGGFDDYREEADRLMTVPGVVGAAPSISGRAVATTSGIEAFVSLKGIDIDLEGQVTDLDDSVLHGSLAALREDHDAVLGGVVIGEDLALQLGAFVGDTVRVLTPQGSTLSPMGMVPRMRPLKVVGIFSLGLYEYDNAYGFVTLDVARQLFRKDRVDTMQLRIADLDDAPAVARAVTDTLGAGYLAEDWGRLNQALFSALWLEKMAIGITIGLIMMVAALNIVASLILLVMEKSRDIAILKTMGATSRSIRRIFVLQGGVIGVVGTLVGAVSGLVVSYVADRYQLIQIPMDVYNIAWVPFRIEPLDFLLVVTTAVLVCLVATIYPSRQASRLDPAEALRYE